jgi:hypothetical protein
MNHDEDDDLDDSVGSDAQFEQAKSALNELGFWRKVDRDRFRDMWPELSGREDWVGRAITIARDKATGGGVQYALKVLANAIDAGVPPGGTGKTNGKTTGPDADYDALKRRYGTGTADEDSRYHEVAQEIMRGYADAA